MSTSPRGRLGRIQPILDTVATIAIIVTCAVLLWRGTLAPASPPPQAKAQAKRAAPILPTAPVSLDGAALEGDRKAPIALIEYSDFQCPFCGNFAREILPNFRERYVTSGRVLLAFRHLPLAEIHPLATRAAETAVCAERQGKFWDFHDRLFSQKKLDESHLVKMTEAVGLDSRALSQCLRDQSVARVSADAASGRTLGITGTPTFLIGTVQSDGRVKVADILVGMQTAQQLDAAVSNLEATAKARD